MEIERTKVWLADVALLISGALMLLGVVWALLVDAAGLALVFVGQFVAALVLYAEWKNGG